MANLLPQDNYDSFLSVALNDSDSTAYVTDLPTKTAGFLTIFEQDGRTFREKIKYTGVASSPNRLTGLVRGLLGYDTAGAYPDTAGTGLDHPAQVRIAMTDNVDYLGRALAQLNGTEELGGVPQLPAARTIDTPRDLVDKEYVDVTAGAAGGINPFLVSQNGADPSLTVNVGAGTFISGATATTYAGAAAQAVTASQTNYVQLSQAGVLDINIVGFTDGYIPLATVVTSGTDITSITDKRSWLSMPLTPAYIAALAGTSGTPSGSNKYVTSAHATATPTASKIPIAGSDATLNGWVGKLTNSSITTGEAIDGSTTPQAVCVAVADGLIYLADGNTSTRVNAYGFITTNASISTTPAVTVSGILGGFTGLTKGAMYYVTDTAGTIGVTPSTTCIIPVGRAISATQLELNFGKKAYKGTITHSAAAGATDSQTATIGFQPAKVTCSYNLTMSGTSSGMGIGPGVWLGTTLAQLFLAIPNNTNGAVTTTSFYGTSFFLTENYGGNSSVEVNSIGSNRGKIVTTIDSVSSTGFVSKMVNTTSAGSGGTGSGTISFIAEE